MRHLRLGIVLACGLMLVLLSTPGHTQETHAGNPEIDEQAMTVLQRMAVFLSQAQHFSVTVDIGFDAIQAFGQKIEFGETRQIVLRRPDHLRVDTTKRDGSRSSVVFNGQEITVFHPQENVYATAASPGSVDEAMTYFVQQLDMRLPLAELLDSNLLQRLQQVRVAAYIESSSIAGVPCDHLALRGDEADIQVWVAQGQKPLPQRIVITYRYVDGRPQFWAQFRDWNLAPAAPDTLFTFTPPPDAARIAFSPRQMLQPESAVTKGGQ